VLVIIGALILGLAAGLLAGGSFTVLSETHFRWWGLALLGLVMQLIPIPSSSTGGHRLGVVVLVASYAVLLAFVAANIRFRGFALLGLGLVLNAVAIGVNGGMPVSPGAIRAVEGVHVAQGVRRLEEHGGGKHHLQRPGDKLIPLTDVIGIGGPVRNVFSPGDLVSMVGMAWVVAAATRGPAGKHARPRRQGGPSDAAQPSGPPPHPTEAGEEGLPDRSARGHP